MHIDQLEIEDFPLVYICRRIVKSGNSYSLEETVLSDFMKITFITPRHGTLSISRKSTPFTIASDGSAAIILDSWGIRETNDSEQGEYYEYYVKCPICMDGNEFVLLRSKQEALDGSYSDYISQEDTDYYFSR